MAEAFSLARRLRSGETVYCAWCAIPSPLLSETIAREGFPAVVLDVQHGLWDIASAIGAIGALHHAGAAPLLRVPLNDIALTSRALDFGAEGIIAPMINTEADARAFAGTAKYPPVGERSWGPLRAMPLQNRTVTVDYLREANEGTLTLAMIETETALKNVDAIAATPGIDALFIGPYDLSTALSRGEKQDVDAPEVLRAIERIRDAAVKAGKVPGIYCNNVERARAMAERGFRFITVGSDLGLVREGVTATLRALKQ
jgi:4-hydroxy-2-oxoheptanedioate aldolase